MTTLPDLVPTPDGAPDPDAIAAGAPAATESPWTITDVRAADWALGKYVTAKATLDQLERQRRDWVALVQDWHRTASGPAARTVEFFDAALRAFVLAERARSPRDAKGEPKVKSIPLVLGRLQTRRGRGEGIDVVDHDAFVSFVLERDLWVDEATAELLRPAGDATLADYSLNSRQVDGDDGPVTFYAIPLEWALLVPTWRVVTEALSAWLVIHREDPTDDEPDGVVSIITREGEIVPGVAYRPEGAPTASVIPNTLATEV